MSIYRCEIKIKLCIFPNIVFSGQCFKTVILEYIMILAQRHILCFARTLYIIKDRRYPGKLLTDYGG